MDLLTLLRISARRWYVTLPVLLLGAACAVLVFQRVAPSYAAQGSILLIGPAERPAVAGQDPQEVNPLLNNDARQLAQTNLALRNQLDSRAVREQIAAEVPDGVTDYTLSDVTDSSLLVVRSVAPVPAGAQATVNQVLAQYQTRLAALQDGAKAPPTQRISAPVQTTPDIATREQGSKVKAAAAVSGAAVLLALLGAGAAEGLAAHLGRRRERAARTAPAATRGSGAGLEARSAAEHSPAPRPGPALDLSA